MLKILAVLGATGKQGSSVINHVLNNKQLSERYKIRAITRDINAEASKDLEQKVEVVQGDYFNAASLEAAFTGVHTLFAITNPDFGTNSMEIEFKSAKTIADLAVKMGIEYIIFSTLPSPNQISGGKYTKVSSFEAKAKAEQYIRSLDIKSAFFSPAGFMENLRSFMAPQKVADDTWVMAQPVSPETPWAWIDASSDIGKFVSAILADPERYEGKTFNASAGSYTWKELAALMSKRTGKDVVYRQLSGEELGKSMMSSGWPAPAVENYIEAMEFHEEFEEVYCNDERLISWSTELENEFGKLTSLEEYVEAHPPSLV